MILYGVLLILSTILFANMILGCLLMYSLRCLSACALRMGLGCVGGGNAGSWSWKAAFVCWGDVGQAVFGRLMLDRLVCCGMNRLCFLSLCQKCDEEPDRLARVWVG